MERCFLGRVTEAMWKVHCCILGDCLVKSLRQTRGKRKEEISCTVLMLLQLSASFSAHPNSGLPGPELREVSEVALIHSMNLPDSLPQNPPLLLTMSASCPAA